ncbi:MAG: hypothetical protein DRJ62_02830 [Thermoprotei archaeon]|nr:MAG: hypothetical protein DRJ62_02830 [Thermoprotei archaeon]
MKEQELKYLLKQVATLVCDYDRTTTNPDLTPSAEALQAIKEAKERLNLKFIMASGRPLGFFMQYGEVIAVADAIVAENGSIIYLPKSGVKRVIGEDVSSTLKALIEELKVPAELFEVIVSIPRSYEEAVKRAIEERGLRVDVEYNVDSIMLLPPGVSKLNGVLEAMKELSVASRGFIAFGDGENDVSIMRKATIAVAVANATPEVKRAAHYVTSKPYGWGVADFIRFLVGLAEGGEA